MGIMLQILFFFFYCMNLNKMIYLEILTALWGWGMTFRALGCWTEQTVFTQTGFLYFELWVWFVCLHWTTAANIWYLQDSKQEAEAMFLTSDLQEK